MRKIKHFAALSLATIIISGCTSAKIQAIKSPTPYNASTITVFRPDVMLAMGNDMIVAVDDKEIAILQNNQFFSALVPPGEHKVSVRATFGLESDVTVKIEPQTTVYFEAAGKGSNSVNFIPGSVFLKSTFYIEASDSFDSNNYTEVFVNYK